MQFAVINGTNRKGNRTQYVTKTVCDLLDKNGDKFQLIDLETIEPGDLIYPQSLGGNLNPRLSDAVSHILEADRLIVVAPEYNGSFPGILKLFIDVIPPAVWQNKKAALVGVAAGRNGNLRGVDQLTAVFNYLNVNVLAYKLNIPQLGQLLNGELQITEPEILKRMEKQLSLLKDF
jgi:chromate reductase, NAD(P)H dehydrogenase (quinone)